MIRTIVVGIDGTEGARHALEWTAVRAAELDAEVVAVFALSPVSEFVVSLPPLAADAVNDLRARFEQDWCRPLRDAGIRYHTHVVEETAAHALLHVADQERADLLVLGADRSGHVADRLFGSVSYVVSHAAPCPVVILPATARAA